MARIRSVKPEFFQDEQLAECSPHARLLAIAILQLCDSHGVFRYIPMQVHAHAFPWEAEVNSPELLRELEGIGYVKFYRASGRQYGFIPGFSKHQRLTGKEAQSDGLYPSPDAADSEGSIGEFPGKHLDAQEQGTGNREQVKDSYESSSTTTVDCPHQQIIDAYEEILPTLPKVRRDMWTGSPAAEALKTRWREDPRRQDLAWWRKLFERIRDRCPHLLGHSGANPQTGKVWHADLRWIVKRENFTKILEGRYVDQRAA